MKTVFLFIATLVMIPMILISQPQSIDKLFNKYAGKDGFVTVDLNDPSSIIPNDDSETKIDKETSEMLKGISSIKVLTNGKGKSGKSRSKEFSEELKGLSVPEDYKAIVTVNESGTYVKILNKKVGQNNDEYLVIVVEENESVLVWVKGKIDITKMKNLGKIFNKSGENNIQIPEDSKSLKSDDK